MWVISDDISTADMSKHDACFGHSRRLMDAGLLALGTLQGRCGMREVTPMTDLGHVNHKDSNTHTHTHTNTSHLPPCGMSSTAIGHNGHQQLLNSIAKFSAWQTREQL